MCNLSISISIYIHIQHLKGVEDRSVSRRDYYTFPLQTTWQQQRNSIAYINTTTFLIYIQRIPRIVGKKRIDDNYFCFVRMKRTADNTTIGTPPPPGSMMKLCLDNGTALKPHLTPSLDSEFHYGAVMEAEDRCAQNGTDFCILLRWNRRAGPLESRSELHDLDDRYLTPAYMTTKFDTSAAERDLVGAIKLADPSYDPDTLTRLREAIMQEPSGLRRTIENHCNIRPKAWASFKIAQEKACGGNQEQYECITKLENVCNKFVGVTGPPGTGKTETVARTLLGAVTQNHKFIGVGPQNISVDGMASKFWQRLPTQYKHGANAKMFLRLATQSAEMRAYVAVTDYMNPSIVDPFTMQSFNEIAPEDAADLAIAWADTITDWKNYDLEIRQAMEEQSKRLERVKTDVPILMTSGWHIHKVILADATMSKDSFLIEWRWRFVHDTVCDGSDCVWDGEEINIIEWSEIASARATCNQSLRESSRNDAHRFITQSTMEAFRSDIICCIHGRIRSPRQ